MPRRSLPDRTRRNGVRDQVEGGEGRNKTWNTGFTRVFASGALTRMHDASERRSVYGNPREQGGPPFLSCSASYCSRLRREEDYAVFLRFPYSARASASFPRSPRRSHILPFCTFTISAIARRAAPAAVTASRGIPRWFQMIPLSATRSGRMPRRAATWETARRVRFRV